MNKKKNNKIITAVLVLTLTGVGVMTYRGYAVEMEKTAAEAIAVEARTETEKILLAKKQGIIDQWSSKVYPGVMLLGVDLSGLTREEAKSKIETEVLNKLNSTTIDVLVKDKTFKLSYSNLNITLGVDPIVEEAMSVGKNLEFEDKVERISSGVVEDLAVNFTPDDAKIAEFVSGIAKEVNQEAKDATIKKEGTTFTVTNHADGLVLDEAKLIADISGVVGDINGEKTLTAEIVVSHPKVTSDSLKQINGQMSSFTTYYGTSAAGRKFNVALAASRINGDVIMPGETYSFLGGVGNVSLATGYKEAGIYVGNKVESGVGGGLCQVSSTLYQAALHGNVGIASRRNHSMAVAYLDPGMDAVVYAPSLDLKLTNNYNTPIYIYAYGAEGKLTVAFYGNTTEMGGKSYKVYSETTAVIQPTVITKEDSTMLVGTQEIEQKPVIGYKSKTYRQTIQNGTVIKTEVISQDSYKKVDKIVKVGTKPVPVVTPPAAETPVAP
ncbi:MAG: VanW family protein [Clostridiaceae bacterium]